MTTFKKSKSKNNLLKEKTPEPVGKEVNPLYKISSMQLLDSLYLLLKKIQKNPILLERDDPKQKQILVFNYTQMKLFYENIFRIKFTQICKPAIKEFLEKYQEKKFSQRKISKKFKKEIKKDENIHLIPDVSNMDNNLSFNILKSVEQCNGKGLMTDFLNTKKRIFEESIKTKTEFTSPELIDNEAFKKIQLTTIKKRKVYKTIL
jgi:hypothetical protein